MAQETDFLDLYGKLRLEPGCSLDEFKQAYRRNVALWHPDRRHGSRADALAAARLQRLTAQYGAAMDFYKRHGRLPGAPLAARPADTDLAAAVDVAPTAAVPPAAVAAPAARGLPLRWWAVAVLIGVGAVVWSTWPDGEVLDTDDDRRAPVVARVDHVPVATLSLGMTTDEVIAIEGEPLRRVDGRWEYGPSWVRFENEQLVDWYSSPLRALHVGSPRPRQ